MFQRAEKEQTVPTEEEVTAEMNKRRTASNLSAEGSKADDCRPGNEESWPERPQGSGSSKLRKRSPVKVEARKMARSRPSSTATASSSRTSGAACSHRDRPANSGQGDTTTNDQEAQLRAKEVGQRALSGADFATLAREFSEDFDTRARGGSGVTSPSRKCSRSLARALRLL